jgi:hypothetical protein
MLAEKVGSQAAGEYQTVKSKEIATAVLLEGMDRAGYEAVMHYAGKFFGAAFGADFLT